MTQYIEPIDINITNLQDEMDFVPIYCPEFTIKSKPDSHTMRVYRGFYDRDNEYTVNISRPECPDGIPVTDIDDMYVNDMCLYSSHNKLTLGKKNMFDQFVFDIEEMCVSKSIAFDKLANTIKTSYKVPIIGFMSNDKAEKRMYPSAHWSRSTIDDSVKFIKIRGKLYEVNKYYRQVGLDYVELQVPSNYFQTWSTTMNLCDENEHIYPPHKKHVSDANMTYSFHHEIVISSLNLQPEFMKFYRVHGDTRHTRDERKNTKLMRKQRYSINVLDNDPGYIGKFELWFRSEITNGQWIKHGIFNGNVGITDSTKIHFDEIQVKEIRIIPLTVHKSFEHVRVNFIGKIPIMKVESDDIFVTYVVSTPRDGKYMKYSSKVPDKYYHVSDMKYWARNDKKKHKARRELNEYIDMF